MPTTKPRKAGISGAIQTERRRLLIDATMSAISDHGLPRLTLAKIAAVAGLSAGSVNFHFDSKEALLLATLTFLAEEFEHTIDKALAEAGSDPAQRMLALFEASLDPEVTEPRKMAVWYAFVFEARGRADYQRICGAQDRKIFAITLNLCEELIRQGNKQDYMNARAMANSVQGLVDEIWQEILYTDDNYDRSDARFIYLSFLASVFPWAYAPPTAAVSAPSADTAVEIIEAEHKHLAAASELFDQYRQFYQQPASPKLARKFIGSNIKQDRSLLLLALDAQGQAVGFTQVYASWCSVSASPYWILYDLYVSSSARHAGVGRALMEAVRQRARKARISRIDLETAVDNLPAQALYEQLGYQRERAFYKYSLPLD